MLEKMNYKNSNKNKREDDFQISTQPNHPLCLWWPFIPIGRIVIGVMSMVKYFAAAKCPKHLHCKAIFSLEKRKSGQKKPLGKHL